MSADIARNSRIVEKVMLTTLSTTFDQESDALATPFDRPLRDIARKSVKVWFNRGRLDRLLTEIITAFPDCELVYALDESGRQISSNINNADVDVSAYGQDLSRRPIAVPLSALNSVELRRAYLCDAYISQVTQRPCVTVMYTVSSGSSVLGYIAADFDPVVLTIIAEEA